MSSPRNLEKHGFQPDKGTGGKQNLAGRLLALEVGTVKSHEHLISRMAQALQSLSPEMLESGTARWGAYELAGLINFNDRLRPDPSRINAHTDGIVHTPFDRAAIDLEKARRVARVAQVASFPSFCSTGARVREEIQNPASHATRATIACPEAEKPDELAPAIALPGAELADGEWLPAFDIEAKANAAGISREDLARARHKLSVEKYASVARDAPASGDCPMGRAAHD